MLLKLQILSLNDMFLIKFIIICIRCILKYVLS